MFPRDEVIELGNDYLEKQVGLASSSQLAPQVFNVCGGNLVVFAPMQHDYRDLE